MDYLARENESLNENFPRSISCKKNQGKHLSEMNSKLKVTTNSFNQSRYDTKKEDQKSGFDKHQMIDQIKNQESEINFLQTVVSHFLDINELFKIRQNSNYDPETGSWTLPSFVVRQRRTVFPNLQRGLVKELTSNEIKKKKVVVKHEEENPGDRLDNRPATSLAPRRSKTKSVRQNLDCDRFRFKY
jgi:hypothetical protein